MVKKVEVDITLTLYDVDVEQAMDTAKMMVKKNIPSKYETVDITRLERVDE